MNRWTRAAVPGLNDPDRAIDLRIALEALFLDSTGGELSFRLATVGARFLREQPNERKIVSRTLREFYNQASRMIHAAPDRRHASADLIDQAMDLCGEGILKIVEDRHQPKWHDVLLG